MRIQWIGETVNKMDCTSPYGTNFNSSRNYLDLPSTITRDGFSFWNSHREMHRNKYPAFVDNEWGSYWYKLGKKHNVNGPAVVIYNPQSKNMYYLNGCLYTKDSWEDQLSGHGTG